MSYVWEHSTHKGTELLTLLAIADFAHDDGKGAYPSIPMLARKTRMSKRQTQYVLRTLQQSGELRIDYKQGPHGVNVYAISLGCSVVHVQKLHGAEIAPKVVQPIAHNPLTDPLTDLGNKNLLTTFVSPAQSETDSVSSAQTSLPLNGVALPSPKEKKAPQLLADDNWIAQELSYYTQEFDVPALNDAVWWANLSNAFPTFTQQWVSMAFADLAAWLTANPSRKPKTSRGWKQRMSYSLKRFDEKFARRQYYAQGSSQQQSRRY